MSFMPTPAVTALVARLVEPLGAVVAGSRVVGEANLTAEDREELLSVVELQAAICIDIVDELARAIRIGGI